ncbi:hypothetical protein RCL_jg9947.t1 [Rhizophagus clarus]|uniref:Uncharacterized protein n=1 Tax=Rhizophagus clarus TaxID=94130 RepID=A0A8H3KR71_9GLOM|nr:hypothetical protein RCL_jg9947.t1 [Rhizophagus clarus]
MCIVKLRSIRPRLYLKFNILPPQIARYKTLRIINVMDREAVVERSYIIEYRLYKLIIISPLKGSHNPTQNTCHIHKVKIRNPTK